MEMQVTPLGLGWGRAPDGRFLIGVSCGGVVVQTFILDHAEEASLRAALQGILLASDTPAPAQVEPLKFNGNGNGRGR